MDIQRFKILNQKVNNGIATKPEKDEYMLMLLNNGNITQEQYNRYKRGEHADTLLTIAMLAGAILLLALILKDIDNK